VEFPNPPIDLAGYFWIVPTDRGRLAHLVVGRLPPQAEGVARRTVCGLEQLAGRAWKAVHASRACARCIDRVR
jgi:hypothetical protein